MSLLLSESTYRLLLPLAVPLTHSSALHSYILFPHWYNRITLAQSLSANVDSNRRIYKCIHHVNNIFFEDFETCRLVSWLNFD